MDDLISRHTATGIQTPLGETTRQLDDAVKLVWDPDIHGRTEWTT